MEAPPIGRRKHTPPARFRREPISSPRLATECPTGKRLALKKEKCLPTTQNVSSECFEPRVQCPVRSAVVAKHAGQRTNKNVCRGVCTGDVLPQLGSPSMHISTRSPRYARDGTGFLPCSPCCIHWLTLKAAGRVQDGTTWFWKQFPRCTIFFFYRLSFSYLTFRCYVRVIAFCFLI